MVGLPHEDVDKLKEVVERWGVSAVFIALELIIILNPSLGQVIDRRTRPNHDKEEFGYKSVLEVWTHRTENVREMLLATEKRLGIPLSKKTKKIMRDADNIREFVKKYAEVNDINI